MPRDARRARGRLRRPPPGSVRQPRRGWRWRRRGRREYQQGLGRAQFLCARARLVAQRRVVPAPGDRLRTEEISRRSTPQAGWACAPRRIRKRSPRWRWRSGRPRGNAPIQDLWRDPHGHRWGRTGRDAQHDIVAIQMGTAERLGRQRRKISPAAPARWTNDERDANGGIRRNLARLVALKGIP